MNGPIDSAETVWTAERAKAPLLQLGKMDEDLFSLDFAAPLSPFQVFPA
jgi:hypothetical protein